MNKWWMGVLLTAVIAVSWGATGPSTRPVESESETLRRIIRNLQGQIATLKIENESLKRRLANLPTTTFTEETPVAAAIRQGKLAPGMTVDEANRAMGSAGKLIRETATLKEYEWVFGRSAIAMPQGQILPGGIDRTVTAFFVDGKLVEYHDN